MRAYFLVREAGHLELEPLELSVLQILFCKVFSSLAFLAGASLWVGFGAYALVQAGRKLVVGLSEAIVCVVPFLVVASFALRIFPGGHSALLPPRRLDGVSAPRPRRGPPRHLLLAFLGKL